MNTYRTLSDIWIFRLNIYEYCNILDIRWYCSFRMIPSIFTNKIVVYERFEVATMVFWQRNDRTNRHHATDVSPWFRKLSSVRLDWSRLWYLAHIFSLSRLLIICIYLSSFFVVFLGRPERFCLILFQRTLYEWFRFKSASCSSACQARSSSCWARSSPNRARSSACSSPFFPISSLLYPIPIMIGTTHRQWFFPCVCLIARVCLIALDVIALMNASL